MSEAPASAAKKRIMIRGIVAQAPIITGTALEFSLRSVQELYLIVRLDPLLQRKDMLFLDTGQTVEIVGTPTAHDPQRILAHKITIVNYPIRRLLHTAGTQ